MRSSKSWLRSRDWDLAGKGKMSRAARVRRVRRPAWGGCMGKVKQVRWGLASGVTGVGLMGKSDGG